MDEEAKQLLRDIRDIGLRTEAAAVRFRRAWVIVVIAVVAGATILFVRLEQRRAEAERAQFRDVSGP